MRRLALIALTLQTAGKIDGRTKLQKMIYLANLIGWNAFDFKYHNFGPYSDALASEIDNMCKSGWVQEDHVGGSYAYSFANNRKELGYSLVNKAIDPESSEKSLVPRTQGLIKSLSSFTSAELEIMATLMYLKIKNSSMSEEQAVELAHKLKPQYTIEDFSKGRRIFNVIRDFLKPAKS
jgi:uncharacterized protein YwgA